MRTTFGSLNIVNTGLFASRRALDVVSHNIANTNTEGYSRQVLMQKASMPIWGDPKGIVGTGVDTYNILRIRNEYLDMKFWSQNKTAGEWSIKQEQLEAIESIFNEPSDTGIRQVLDEYFIALDELSKSTGDSTKRVAVVERANILAVSINRNGHEIVNAIRDANSAVKSKVEEINSLGTQISILNRQIYNMELGDTKANDLRDQRTVLMDKLSRIIDIEVKTSKDSYDNEILSIKLGGITFIEHTDLQELDYVDVDVPGITDLGAGKMSQIVWKGMESQKVLIRGGELKGLLEVRDGDGQGLNYRGLRYYLGKLNEFAKDFAIAINEQHKKGVDFYGESGENFFMIPIGGEENINSLNFAINDYLKIDPNRFAASSHTEGESNNENLMKIIDLKTDTTLFQTTKGTCDDFIKAMLSTLAVDSQQSIRMYTNNEILVAQTDITRMSESGVLLDEEMGNLVKFNQTYSAAAMAINTLDKILDTTINRLGMAGR